MEYSEIQESLSKKEGWTIWSLSGSLNRLNFNEISEVGEKHLENAVKFAIDLSKLVYMSSAGIRVLLRLAKTAKTNGKDLVILSPAGVVKDTIECARIDVLIPCLESLD